MDKGRRELRQESYIFTELDAFMRRKCATQPIPAFTDLDLMEVYRIAGYVYMLDVEGPKPRLRTRFAGTKLYDLFGQDITGFHLNDLNLGLNQDAWISANQDVATDGVPVFSRGSLTLKANWMPQDLRDQPISTKHAAYPALGACGTVRHIVGAIVPIDAPAAETAFITQTASEFQKWETEDVKTPSFIC